MRLHTYATEDTIRDAAAKAGATLERFTRHGSRSRDHAFEVILSGDGRRGGQWAGGDTKSATWDQWGIFLNHIYEVDQTMKCWAYEDADDFHWKTGERFKSLKLADQHIQHRWDYRGRAVTGAYWVRECKCGAVSRAA